MPTDASASTMSSAAPISAMRFKGTIRLLKKQKRAGVKRVRLGPPAVDARRFVCARPCGLGRFSASVES